MNRRALHGLSVAAVALLAGGCGSLVKHSKIQQYASPEVDATRFRSVTVISGHSGKYDLQVTGRVRDKIAASNIRVVRKSGLWESDVIALREICTQGANETENVDGVVFVRWDRVTLHDCETGKIATDINGGYAGTDAMAEHLLRYLGANTASRTN